MPIQPEPAYQLLIIAATALIVCFLLYLVHRYWKNFTITSVDDLEAARAPYDNYCALLDIAQRFQHIADIAQQRATICKTAAEQMQRENNRQWKARNRGSALLGRDVLPKRPDVFTAPKSPPKNGTPSALTPSRETTPRTHRPCYVCNKPFGPLDPIRMDPKTGHVYHDKCAVEYINNH